LLKIEQTQRALSVNTHMHFCAHLQHTQTYPSSHASNKSTLIAFTPQSCTTAVYQNTTTQLHMLPLHTTQFSPRSFVGLSPRRQDLDPRGICGGQSITRTTSPVSIIPLQLHTQTFIHSFMYRRRY